MDDLKSRVEQFIEMGGARPSRDRKEIISRLQFAVELLEETMHMGTSTLIYDLWMEVERLRKAAAEKKGRQL
ncbi:MAG: hypothetical protein WAN65_20605 [Candidatus Sulfotelmatobacter sp.]